ncbi:hypothetical protein Y1Q_0002448 [Alligator mississippiensis]|uniref:Uncharacterized protein n=1 Tax=Alligator mississippiensis TaxID=8496 RepID=A0A151NY84_ALLMI|nr:hypothetical protein Y1Q_0002448 [Alligator mississippiensis]
MYNLIKSGSLHLSSSSQRPAQTGPWYNQLMNREGTAWAEGPGASQGHVSALNTQLPSHYGIKAKLEALRPSSGMTRKLQTEGKLAGKRNTWSCPKFRAIFTAPVLVPMDPDENQGLTMLGGTWTKINNWSYCSQDGEANIFRSGITLEYLMASTIVLIFRDAKSKDDLAPLFQVLRSPSIPGDIGYSFGPGGFTADGLERCQQPHFCGISEQGPV